MGKNQGSPIRDEAGFGDPLNGAYDNFNTLDFVSDNEPSENRIQDSNRFGTQNYVFNQLANCNLNQVNFMNQDHQRGPSIMNNNIDSNRLNSNIMYTNNSRLPDSPPVTDISGGGSSGSPSSTSESPYSPDHYQNYGNMIQNNVQLNGNSNQMSMNERSPQMIGMNRDLMSQQGHPNSRIIQQPVGSNFANNYIGVQHNIPNIPHGQIAIQNGMSLNGNGATNPIHYHMLPQSTYNMLDHPYASNVSLSQMPNNDVQPMIIANQQQPPRTTNPGPPNKRKRVANDNAPANGPNIKSEIRTSPKMNYYGGSVPQIRQLSSTPTFIGGSMSTHSDDYEDSINQKTIKFQRFQEEFWHTLVDENNHQLNVFESLVVADKGFNFSPSDNCFVNQKKNHFQISVQIEALDDFKYCYVHVNDKYSRVDKFKLAFSGVKSEIPNSEILIKQSQTDRKPVPHEPQQIGIEGRKMTKVMVPRLHFSETTNNNQRKNNKPNPEQRYFNLIVKLMAYTVDHQVVLVQAFQSDRVIVRASNPGQFEPPESDGGWRIGNGNTLHYPGNVAIGTEKAVAPLTVNGNIFLSGFLTKASDIRLKDNICNIDTKEALERLRNLRIVEFKYKDNVAEQWGLPEEDRVRIGVIAQELAEILPIAVKDNGDFLTVDDSQLFYDTVAAAKELCKFTDYLDGKIDKVERKQNNLKREVKKRDRYSSIASGLSEISSLWNGDDKKQHGSVNSLDSYEDEGSVKGRKRREGPQRCIGQPLKTITWTSSKLQYSISTLVGMMALCLVAMSILYFSELFTKMDPAFDRSNRNMSHFNQSHNQAIGFLYENMTARRISHLPHSQPKATILFDKCLSGNCHQFCCAGKHEYASNSIHATQNLEMVDSIISLPSNNTDQSIVSTMVKDNNNMLSSNLRIDVLNLNVTIDSDYCVKDSCDQQKGLYDLYIPISTHMPTVSLQLRFTHENEDLIISNCGAVKYFEHLLCNINVDKFDYQLGTPSSTPISDNIFHMSVGSYKQSAFRFRVGYASNACSMGDDFRGLHYDEYTLVFYRTCFRPNQAGIPNEEY
uniref:NDT80 domain-containing protein n=1 Tax=Rhabditophanes sp. KR3021 TaxID=114890 RepID=A0AC35U9K7_9BILA